MIKTKYNARVTCPWCGYEDPDSNEYMDDEYDCAECRKPFVVIRKVNVSYQTYKIRD